MNVSHSSCTLLISWHVTAAYIWQVIRTCSVLCTVQHRKTNVFWLSPQALTKMKITASNDGM